MVAATNARAIAPFRIDSCHDEKITYSLAQHNTAFL
jgi:hypothetical protein